MEWKTHPTMKSAVDGSSKDWVGLLLSCGARTYLVDNKMRSRPSEARLVPTPTAAANIGFRDAWHPIHVHLRRVSAGHRYVCAGSAGVVCSFIIVTQLREFGVAVELGVISVISVITVAVEARVMLSCFELGAGGFLNVVSKHQGR
jgi:hypothetical protein